MLLHTAAVRKPWKESALKFVGSGRKIPCCTRGMKPHASPLRRCANRAIIMSIILRHSVRFGCRLDDSVTTLAAGMRFWKGWDQRLGTHLLRVGIMSSALNLV